MEFTPYLIKSLVEVTDTLWLIKNAIKPTITTTMFGCLLVMGLKWSNCTEEHDTVLQLQDNYLILITQPVYDSPQFFCALGPGCSRDVCSKTSRASMNHEVITAEKCSATVIQWRSPSKCQLAGTHQRKSQILFQISLQFLGKGKWIWASIMWTWLKDILARWLVHGHIQRIISTEAIGWRDVAMLSAAT